ncbi:hypothetical protein [Tamlana flava]|uniref:hypothetical protein n=1 Tax=Tamlana flava TaxID=3158572 RepID=UPI00351B96E8
MKYLSLFIFTFSFYIASAQISFNSGSAQLDSDLKAINTQASLNLSLFNKEMHVSYHVSEKKLNYMSVSLGMIPGEIYFSLEISKIAKVSLDRVLTIYKNHKSRGWGVIAKELGIKPGSVEFHQLKKSASSRKDKSQGKKHMSTHKKKGKN